MDPPSVEGWHTGQEWIDSGSLLRRINFVANRVGDTSLPGVKSIIQRLAARDSLTATEIVDGCIDLMGPAQSRRRYPLRANCTRGGRRAGSQRRNGGRTRCLHSEGGGSSTADRFYPGVPIRLIPQFFWRQRYADRHGTGQGLQLQPHHRPKTPREGPGFRHPVDLALGSNGSIYVINRGDEFQSCQRVSVITMDEEFIRDFGGAGTGDGQFTWPTAIALDRDDNVYVADEWLNRISIFDKDGAYLGKWGTAGAGAGQLNGPSGIVFDGDDNVYITEELTHRVQKFTKDGQYILGWGSEGQGPGELNHPWGIDLDSRGDVYVADWHNDRIQKFSPEGEFLSVFGSSGDGVGELKLPSDVAVDSEGDVYVTGLVEQQG